jgi:hypothetical protein
MKSRLLLKVLTGAVAAALAFMRGYTCTRATDMQARSQTLVSAIRLKLLRIDLVPRQILSFCTQATFRDLRCSHVPYPVTRDYGGLIRPAYFGARLTILSLMSIDTSFAKLITSISMWGTCDGWKG